MKTDKRIDAYIVKAQPFAVPILEHLRGIIHEACPDGEETMKWSFPHFMYNGSILCSFASFKAHCAFGFWLGSLMKDPAGVLETADRNSMGHLGRITDIKDLPSKKILTAYIKEAMSLIDEGVARPAKQPTPAEKKKLSIPQELVSVLVKRGNKKAKDTFDAMSYSHKKEYVEWITGAKTDATRDKRLATTIEYLQMGKSLNWKYNKAKA